MRRFIKPLLLIPVTLGMLLLLASGVGQWIPDDPAPPDEVIRSPGTERITVEVRNAGGVDGMARAATERLRSAGFDVVGIGNAARFDQEESVVIDRVGRPESAADVARALGIDRVESEPDPNLFVDVTVRLGSEWAAPQRPEPVRKPVLDWLRGTETHKETDASDGQRAQGEEEPGLRREEAGSPGAQDRYRCRKEER